MTDNATHPPADTARWPWPAGAATGIGSLPGTDPGEALRMVFGDLPDLPYLPELPGRGPGGDLLGRGAGLLVDLPVELYVGHWRLAAHRGIDLRRANDMLDRDRDELVEVADGYTGPLKIAAAGPLTLAAGLDLPLGGAVLRDPGARRDLTDSLAEGLRRYVADIAARVPGATILLQLDEPSLPAVLAGRVHTESGLGVYPAVPEADAAETLHAVIGAAGVPTIVHCCAPDVPIGVVRSAGATALALDLDLLPDTAASLDMLGEALEAGLGLLAGVIPTTAPRSGSSGSGSSGSRSSGSAAPSLDVVAADRIRLLWHKLGLPVEDLPAQVVITQSCGLAGSHPDAARAALRAGRDAARRLADDPRYRQR